MRLIKPETNNLKELEKCLCEFEGGMRLDVVYDRVQLSGFHPVNPSFYYPLNYGTRYVFVPYFGGDCISNPRQSTVLA